MAFKKIDKKGLKGLWIHGNLPEDRLSIHISQIEPGTRAHPPHTHDGVESFFCLEGKVALEIGDERLEFGANEGVVLDPGTIHGLVNIGDVPARYMVIIAK